MWVSVCGVFLVFLISTCCYLQCAQFSDCLRKRCDTFVMQKKKHFLVWLLQWLCNVKFAIQEDQLIDCCLLLCSEIRRR
jgi:hypothetical protein